MSEQFRYLLSPLQIGSVTVRNRVMISALTMKFAQDGMISEQHAYYYAERAKGGVGLITTEMQGVHPTTGGRSGICEGYSRSSIPRYKLVADMVHEHGAKVFAQLWHCGQNSQGAQIWAPSPVAGVHTRHIPKEMEFEDIRAVVEGFVHTAANTQEAGIDGIELHAAHGYLIPQFWSPISNKRTDDYGGSLENRMRFSDEVIDAIRRECGREFVMGVRISGDEFVEGGLGLEDMKVIARRLEASGQIDFLHVSGGVYHSQHTFIPTMYLPLGPLVHLAAGIREAVDDLPVFTVGRIKDPIQAEQILANGYADVVAMTRAHICDPEIVNKIKAGRLDDIRPCISCNQGCQERVASGSPGSCISNVAVGREKRLGIGTLERAATRKTVMVIGGGPAGLEAARVAAMRGHGVSLYEKANELGGQLNLAAKGPGRAEMTDVPRWLSAQVGKLGVKVHLGEEMTVQRVLEARPDAVVVATGSLPDRSGFTPLRPHLAGIEGCDQQNVVTVWDVLGGTAEIGQNVVVIDDDGHHRAASTAEYLAESGRRVEILSRLPFPYGDLVSTYEQPLLYARLIRRGVSITPYTGVRKIEGRTVIAFNVYTNEDRVLEDVDTIVLAMGNIADNALYRALKGKVKEVYPVGDCVAPRRIITAIWEGHQAGRAL